MPSHTVSFSICVDLELLQKHIAPDVLRAEAVTIDVIDNEGRAAPKWLLARIRDNLLENDYERIMAYMERDAAECARR